MEKLKKRIEAKIAENNKEQNKAIALSNWDKAAELAFKNTALLETLLMIGDVENGN